MVYCDNVTLDLSSGTKMTHRKKLWEYFEKWTFLMKFDFETFVYMYVLVLAL